MEKRQSAKDSKLDVNLFKADIWGSLFTWTVALWFESFRNELRGLHWAKQWNSTDIHKHGSYCWRL